MDEVEKHATSVDAELEKKLELYLQLKKAASQYEKLKKELAPLFDGVTRTVVGRFVITGSLQKRAEKVVKAFEFWSWKVDEPINLAVLAAAQEGET